MLHLILESKQCQAHGLTLLTRDENIPRYEVATFWA